jgi:hypothetical protein
MLITNMQTVSETQDFRTANIQAETALGVPNVRNAGNLGHAGIDYKNAFGKRF